MWLKQCLYGILLISVLNTVSCAQRQVPPPYILPEPKTAQSPATAKTVVVDPKLESALSVLAEDTEKLPNGNLKISLTLQNNTGTQLKIRVRTTFKNEKSIPIGDETNWEKIIIPKYTTQTYLCTSYSDKASKYTIEILSE